MPQLSSETYARRSSLFTKLLAGIGLMAAVCHEDVLSVLRSVLALSRRFRDERAPGATTLAGVSILGALHRSGTVPSSRLAEAERLEPQSLTRQLADLEKRGFISRVR